MFRNLLAEAAASGQQATGDNTWLMWVIGGLVVLLIAAMVVLPMITNKKKAKAENEKRDMLTVGDTVMTIGGVIGVVKELREPAPGRREFVIETGTGSSATTITFDIKALYAVLNSVNKPTKAAEKLDATHTSAENIVLKEEKESEKKDKSNGKSEK